MRRGEGGIEEADALEVEADVDSELGRRRSAPASPLGRRTSIARHSSDRPAGRHRSPLACVGKEREGRERVERKMKANEREEREGKMKSEKK